MILASHFSFGSGGGVPAMGCGRGRVTRAAAVFAVGRFAIGRLAEYKAKKWHFKNEPDRIGFSI